MIVKSFDNRVQIIFAEYRIAGYQVHMCYFVTKSHFLLPYYKLAGREQLAAQGVSGRQVHKGVAGGSQRRGSVASPVMIGRSRNAAGNHPFSAGRMTSGGRQLCADRSGSGGTPGRAQHTTFRWCIVAPYPSSGIGRIIRDIQLSEEIFK